MTLDTFARPNMYLFPIFSKYGSAIYKFQTSFPNELRHDKTNNVAVRPAKTQISLGIRSVWSESSLCAHWIAKDPRYSEKSYQTGQMPRLIWVFAGRTLTLLVLSCRGFSSWCQRRAVIYMAIWCTCIVNTITLSDMHVRFIALNLGTPTDIEKGTSFVIL